jgi:hypothetical protein
VSVIHQHVLPWTYLFCSSLCCPRRIYSIYSNLRLKHAPWISMYCTGEDMYGRGGYIILDRLEVRLQHVTRFWPASPKTGEIRQTDMYKNAPRSRVVLLSFILVCWEFKILLHPHAVYNSKKSMGIILSDTRLSDWIPELSDYRLSY